jgi:hypothetical protein
MRAETVTALNEAPPLKIVSDPFYEVIIDAKDHSKIYKKKLMNWTRSVPCSVITYNGSTFVGLSKKYATANVDLTETVNFPDEGYYRVELRIRKHPDDTGTITFYADDTKIENHIEANYPWDHIERVRYPIRWYTSGDHDLKLSLTKQSYVESIKIEKITRHMGNSDGEIEPGCEELNLNYIDFTMNSLNQLDTANVKVGMKDSYWNDTGDYLPLNMGFTDSITIIVGETRETATPMFGGYILQAQPKGNVLNILCVDRLFDLQRNVVHHNFSIGTVPASDNTQKINYIMMGSVYELIRRLATTQEYIMNTSGIPPDYGFYLNFGGLYDFDNLTVTGWTPHRDPVHGMTPPCLRLTLGDTVGDAECIFFDDTLNPWNAAEHAKFFMHYYASGVGVRYPLEFNLKFRMYKYDETEDEAVDYIVYFNGPTNQANAIGSIKPKLNGVFNYESLNLKGLFDRYAPSSEYNIIKGSFVGEITQDMLDNKACSAIWIDNIHSYKEVNGAIYFKGENNVKTSHGEIVDVCDKTKHVAFTRPGIERRDDILVVLPEEHELLPVAIDENSNLITVEDWKNNPRDMNFQNQSRINFNFANDKAGSAQYEDEDSIDHFGPFETYSHEADIHTQPDADTLVRNNVLDNKDANRVGFTVKITGTTLLEIGQLMAAEILSHKITGVHKVAAITTTIDMTKGVRFEQKLDMNYPGIQFKKRSRLISRNRELQNLGVAAANQSYNNYGNQNLANASKGAYTG